MEVITPNYSLASNKKKAIYSLKGTLKGVTADKQLNEMECLYLNTWLLESKPLRDDPDAIDLLDTISDALADGKFSADELEDINNLVTDIIDYKSFETIETADHINEFLGLISGIVADDVINASELQYLLGWLSAREEVINHPITQDVSYKILDYTNIKEPTETETNTLLNFLKKTTGTNFSDTGATSTGPLDHIADIIESMSHMNARICFTGVFNKGSRKEVEAIANDLGATTRKDPSKSIDYVIIGSQISPDWKHSSFGRKIQKAVELRDGGHPLYILTEDHWLTFT